MEVGTMMAIGSILGGVGGILAATRGGGGGDAALAPPALPKPTVMPTPDDDAAARDKRRKLSGLAQRRGRQSTILSDNTQSADLLGG